MTPWVESVGFRSNLCAASLSRPNYPEHDSSSADAVVHLVGFDPEASAGLGVILATAGVVTRCCSTGEPLDSDAYDIPGCVLLYARCEQIERPEFFDAAERKSAGLPVIVAADGADARTIVFALKAGAVDFVEPPFHEEDVLEAVATAIMIDRRRRKVAAQRAEVCRRFATLTPREREVMALVTAGRLNKQAAGDLGLSEITIKAHRGSAMRKMAARTITDLVRMADLLAAISLLEVDVAARQR